METRLQSPIITWVQSLLPIVAVTIVVLLPFHAFLSTWAGSLFGAELLWKSWKELVLAGMVPLVALYCWLRPDVARAVWQQALTKIIAGYTVLHVVLSIFTTVSTEAIIAGLLMNLRFLALFVLVQVMIVGRPQLAERLQRWLPPWLLWLTIGLSIVALLQVTVIPKDFLAQFGYNPQTISPYTLVDDNPEAVRAFATLRGPNTFGAYLLLPLAMALYLLYKRRHIVLSIAALLVGLPALLASGSRSAWLGFAATIATLAIIAIPPARYKQWLRWAVLPGVVVLGLLVLAAITIPALRLAVFHSSPTDPHLFEGSTEKHWQATAAGAVSALANPWGQGVGSAGPASFYNTTQQPFISENYFVQLAQEVGLIGLGLFLAICFLVMRRLKGSQSMLAPPLLASFVGISLTCLFLHTWADDPLALTWWAVAALVLAPVKGGKS